jgi:hypothetical protein
MLPCMFICQCVGTTQQSEIHSINHYYGLQSWQLIILLLLVTVRDDVYFM